MVSYNERLKIGRDSTISGNVFISNVDHNYKEIGVHVLKQDMLEVHTQIGENCFIEYGTVIMSGNTLERQCIVGANSVVKGTFPDFSVIAGSPVRVVKKYDVLTGSWVKVNKEEK